MSATTVRVDKEIREKLRELAAQNRCSMRAVLEQAVEAYRRQVFLEKTNEAFAALRANPQAWEEELEERQEWEATLMDGIDQG
jgi:hypothetical protein